MQQPVCAKPARRRANHRPPPAAAAQRQRAAVLMPERSMVRLLLRCPASTSPRMPARAGGMCLMPCLLMLSRRGSRESCADLRRAPAHGHKLTVEVPRGPTRCAGAVARDRLKQCGRSPYSTAAHDGLANSAKKCSVIFLQKKPGKLTTLSI